MKKLVLTLCLFAFCVLQPMAQKKEECTLRQPLTQFDVSDMVQYPFLYLTTPDLSEGEVLELLYDDFTITARAIGDKVEANFSMSPMCYDERYESAYYNVMFKDDKLSQVDYFFTFGSMAQAKKAFKRMKKAIDAFATPTKRGTGSDSINWKMTLNGREISIWLNVRESYTGVKSVDMAVTYYK